MSAVFPITEDPRYRLLTASAGQREFSITFPFLVKTDITAYRIATTGIQTAMAQPTDYTVTGAGDIDGGTLRLKTVAASGEKVLIVGAASRARSSSIVRNGKYDSKATDDDIDRLTLIAQELDRELGRRVSVDYDVTPPQVTIGAAGTVPVWDADGNLIEGPSASALEALDAALGLAAGRALIYPASPAAPVYDAGSRKIGSVANGTDAADAVNKGQLDAVLTVAAGLAVTQIFFDVASQAAMLALDAKQNDIAVRADVSKCYALSSNDPTDLSDWKELKTPADAVSSVATLTGAISAANLRTALSLVVGTNVQAQNALLADIAGITFANGDVLYYNSGHLLKLAKSTDGKVLTLSSGLPSWQPSAAAAWTTIVKPADETRAGTSTLADGDLQFAMLANTTYRIRISLFFAQNTTGGAALKYQLTGPTSPTQIDCRTGKTLPGGSSESVALNTSYPGATLGSGDGEGIINFDLIAQNVNAGTFSFDWCKSGGVTSVTLRKGCLLEYAAI